MISPLVVILVTVIPVLGRLIELSIRYYVRLKIERARQMAALRGAMTVRPGMLMILEQPDGTSTVIARGLQEPLSALLIRCGEAPDGQVVVGECE